MAKKNKETYQDYINSGDNGISGLSGLRWRDTNEPIEAIGSIGNINLSQKKQAAQESSAPWTENVSDVYGKTDFGNSIYDKEITNSTQLNNLEDTRASIQPFIDKVGAGIGTFAGKTVTATAGGLGSLFYGVPKAIIDGRFSAIYDNDFQKWLQKGNDAVDDSLKVYMSDAERNGTFFQQTIGSANFWTKSLLGDGMSFTAGAILSAYALGGIGSALGYVGEASGLVGAATKIGEGGEIISKAGLLNKGVSAIGKGLSKFGAFSDEASNAALWGKNEFGFGEKLLSKTANTLKGASSVFDGTQSMQELANATKWEQFIGGAQKLGGTSARIAVGSMYEGGTEANDYLKQADTRDTQEYYEKFGQPQTQEDLDRFNAHKKEFNDHSLNVANALFLGNVALVGGAELAVFPSVFGKGVNETIKDARKLVGSKVIDGVEQAFVKGSERKGLAKIGKALLTGFEPLYAEGIQEEGGQNFMKNLALDYIDKHYNPDSAKNNYDLANSLGNAFSQAYMTKDGWKEILSGMIIGGLGAANLSNMGAIETKEDGTKVWNKFGNLKNRKLINYKDAQNSWWTGGIVGAFQEEHENHLRAKELVDEVNTQRTPENIAKVHDYFAKNMAQGQGIESQISHINHIASANSEYDAAILGEDHYTAKNMEDDVAHIGIKSRIDAGFYDTIHQELVEPIEKMSPQAFAEQYGYENMTEQQIRERQSNVVKQAKQKIQDTVDAINFADKHRTFDLGTEEGRLNRNMLIYAIATGKSVGDRIENLTNTVSKNIKDRLIKYKFDETQFDKGIEFRNQEIDKLNKSKEGKSESETKIIDEKINKHQEVLSELEDRKAQISKAKEVLSEIENGGYNATTVSEAKISKDIISALMTKKKRHSHDTRPQDVLDAREEDIYNETMTALDDLVKLNRRKEEALELYTVTKDPQKWSHFWKTERIGKRIEKMQLDAINNIIQSQNEEHAKAKDLIDNGTDPKTAHDVSGADISTVEKILNNKKSVQEAKISKSLYELLQSINSQSDHKFESIQDLLDTLTETIEDDDASEQEHDSAQILADRINELIDSAKQPIAPIDESIPSKDGLLDKNQDIRPVGESDIQETNDINDKANQDLKSDDKTTSSNIESDLLVDAFNHIAWNNVSYDNKTGKFIYYGINPKASKLLQDYTKLKVGQKVEFKVNPTAEFPAEDLEYIKIDVVINGEVVGQVHTTDYINPNRVVDTDGNLERNITELKDLRNAILSGKITESQIEKVGNGRLITAREFGGNKTDNIPTTQALPDKSAIITVVDSGVIKNKPKNSVIINEGKIATGKGNNFRNGMFVLLPINQLDEGGITKTKYIATPLSPMTLNKSQAQTLSTLIELFIRNQSGQIDDETKTIFDTIAKSMQSKMSYRDEISDQEINFNPRSLNGLRNIIKLFTYDRVSLNDDLNEAGEARADKKIFGINQMKNGSLVVSFGTPKNVTSYKIQQNEAGQFEFFIKKPITGPINSKWEKIDNVDSFFTELGDGTENHLKQSFFYHNKALINQTVNVPTLEMDENGLSVKFDTKPYTQFIKENTQTNLRSVDLGDGNYSYTVQRNIVFAIPKVEKIEQHKVKTEAERPTSIITSAESQQKPEVREKQQLQQRRGNGKSIERKKPLSEEDLLPSFSEITDEQVGFETKEKSPNLQMDFITYAKLQPNEIKRSLIAMNRNKEIEVKCK